MIFRQLFDRTSSTYTYLLADPATRQAVLIDPVLEHVERDRTLLADLELTLVKTLETHVHADHITGAAELKDACGSTTVVGSAAGATCADEQPGDGAWVSFGHKRLEVRHTPGHTGGCVVYVDHESRRVFTGDTLFIRGCGRTDFQAGDAATLYRSVHEQILSLPDDYAIYPGHDYQGFTSSTVAEEKAYNPRLGGGRSVEEFQAIMAGLELGLPAKIAVAVPANLRCGREG